LPEAALAGRFIGLQSVVVSGTESAVFAVKRAGDGVELELLSHQRPGAASDEVRRRAVEAFRELIQPCTVQDKDGMFEVQTPVKEPTPQFCLVTMLRRAGTTVAASAVIVRRPGSGEAKESLRQLGRLSMLYDVEGALDGLRKLETVAAQLADAGIAPQITCVSMGNPHAVLFGNDVAKLPLESVGPIFEHAPIFPRRTNVHFVQPRSRDELVMRTWERGSGITLACGTGACAVVMSAP